MTLREQIVDDMKSAMRAHDHAKLSAIRLLLAEIKQKEVDERISADDSVILQIITKQIKQRKDSIEQYNAGGRPELAAAEQAEIDTFMAYMPKQMSDEEIDAVIRDAIAQTGATGMAQMGKVIGAVRGKVAGKADMGKVSARVKALLSA